MFFYIIQTEDLFLTIEFFMKNLNTWLVRVNSSKLKIQHIYDVASCKKIYCILEG